MTLWPKSVAGQLYINVPRPVTFCQHIVHLYLYRSHHVKKCQEQTHLSTVAAPITDSNTTKLSPTELSIVGLRYCPCLRLSPADGHLRMTQAFVKDESKARTLAIA